MAKDVMSIRCDNQMRSALETAARLHHTTISAYITEALEHYLGNDQKYSEYKKRENIKTTADNILFELSLMVTHEDEGLEDTLAYPFPLFDIEEGGTEEGENIEITVARLLKGYMAAVRPDGDAIVYHSVRELRTQIIPAKTISDSQYAKPMFENVSYEDYLFTLTLTKFGKTFLKDHPDYIVYEPMTKAR